MADIFKLAHIRLEKEGVFEWFDYNYYWDKWFEYIEKISAYKDRLKSYERYNQKRERVIHK